MSDEYKNKSYINAGIDSDLHRQIKEEAARNKQSFSAQIREYKDLCIKLEEDLVDARSEIKALKERSNN